jgi:hypothetical protein
MPKGPRGDKRPADVTGNGPSDCIDHVARVTGPVTYHVRDQPMSLDEWRRTFSRQLSKFPREWVPQGAACQGSYEMQ